MRAPAVERATARPSASWLGSLGVLTDRACLAGLVVTFFGAATYKLAHPADFVGISWSFLPAWATTRLSAILIGTIPVAELAVCVLLVIPSRRRAGAWLAAALLALFTVVLWFHYRDGNLALGCGCNWPFLKVLVPASLPGMLLRNACLLIMTLLAGTSTRALSGR